MRFRFAVVLTVLWTSVVSGVASAQFAPEIKFRYTCASGRFRVSYGKGVWHYCYDGKYYNEKTLPADIRAYFAAMDQRMKESQAKFKEDWAEHEQKMAQYDSDRAAQGLPTRAQMQENARQRNQSGGAYRLTPGGGIGGGMGTVRRGGTVEASRKPEAEPVTLEALKAVAPGTTAADLVAALGEPPGKVTTGEGAESWTYVLTTGAFAKVKMEAGGVKEVVLP